MQRFLPLQEYIHHDEYAPTVPTVSSDSYEEFERATHVNTPVKRLSLIQNFLERLPALLWPPFVTTITFESLLAAVVPPPGLS
jgi:hypothetical protein